MRDHISFKLNWINQQIYKLRYAVKLIKTTAMTKHNATETNTHPSVHPIYLVYWRHPGMS